MMMKFFYQAVLTFISSTNNTDQAGVFVFARVTKLKDLF